MKNQLTITFLLWLSFNLQGQRSLPHLADMDVLHYRFALELTDSSDMITGEAEVKLQLRRPLSAVVLDFKSMDAETGLGMSIIDIEEEGAPLPYTHENDRLRVELAGTAVAGQTRMLNIRYKGIPADGLVIGNNKYGARTFFGDNWPNRAHHWLPVLDHPSDKATVEFIVTAPEHYQVIGNGRQIEETNLPQGRKLTHWRSDVALPTKVMVIGAAAFAVQLAGEVQGIPVTSWVYPEDRQAGFYDYAQAVDILSFFIDYLGPYPYEKLANVQSKTRYGGMENAGNIFYTERSVTGLRNQEALIAHEIVHQWFGNSATEGNWYHIWLSEGFATYLTNVYLEHKYGADAIRDRLGQQRERVVGFAATYPGAVIDTSVTDYNQLLNANSYEKGGWILHMLRHEIGDRDFRHGLRAYYQQYRDGNALTADFQKVMERSSGRDLDTFFQQWLYRGGVPQLKISWEPAGQRNKYRISVSQQQDGPAYQIPLDLLLHTGQGDPQKITLHLDEKEEVFILRVRGGLQEVIPDPELRLLFVRDN